MWLLVYNGENTVFPVAMATSDFTYKMIRIANRAVQKAQEEKRRKGIHNVYELKDRLAVAGFLDCRLKPFLNRFLPICYNTQRYNWI